MKYNQLGKTDMKVSVYSLGASAFGRIFGHTDDEESVNVVRKAIDSGINLIDTAPWYGQGKSEEVLGKILPQIPRSSYYLSTKVCRYEKDINKMFDFSAEKTTSSVDESLRRMGVDYVDIIQAHDIEFAPSLDIVINETLPAMQKLKEQGKARYIGVTGYPIDVLKKAVELSSVKIDTILSYCHGSMCDNSLQDEIQFFKDRGIGVINAAGLSMGLLSDHGPAPWHPASDQIKAACRKAVDYCKERNTNISKLAVHFSLSQPDVCSTLFSSPNLKELEANLNVAENGISDEEKQIMAEVMERFFDPLESRNWIGVELKQYWNLLKGENKDSAVLDYNKI